MATHRFSCSYLRDLGHFFSASTREYALSSAWKGGGSRKLSRTALGRLAWEGHVQRRDGAADAARHLALLASYSRSKPLLPSSTVVSVTMLSLSSSIARTIDCSEGKGA